VSSNNVDVKATITADDQASKVLSDFGGNVQSASDRAVRAFQAAAIAAAALAVTGIGAAAKASFDQVDAVQQATIALKAYESNGDKVNTVLKNLIAYARSDLGVLFNRKDLFEAAQSLKLYGDNTDQLVDHVKILSRSVGLGLSSWDELNLIVGRVGSTGRLTGDDFDNLSKAGFKLDTNLRNTNITFTDLFTALDKGIPTDALAGQANTIQGLNIRLQTAFRGVGDAILGVDSNTSEFIKGGLGDRFTQAVVRATEALKDLKQPIADLYTIVPRTADSFKNLFDQFLNLTPVIILGQYIQQVLVPGLQAIWAAIAQNLIPAFAQYIDAVQRLWNALNPGLTEALKLIAEILGGILLVAIWAIIAADNVLIQVFSMMISVIANVVNWIANLISWLGNLAGGAINAGSAVISVFSNMGSAILKSIGNFGSLLYDKGRDLISGLINGIQDRIGDIGGAISSVGNKVGDSVKGALSKLHVPGFAEGGFTGSGGINDVAGVVHKGEYVLPQSAVDQSTGMPKIMMGGGGGGSTVINISVNAGAYMGNQNDARKYAMEVFKSLQDIAASRNMQLADLIGVTN
jgi:hypothetical protein